MENFFSIYDALLDSMVRLSGMTKQDYIIARLLKFEITVQGNPKVYKAMKQELAFLCGRLSESGFLPDSDWAARLDHLLPNHAVCEWKHPDYPLFRASFDNPQKSLGSALRSSILLSLCFILAAVIPQRAALGCRPGKPA